MAFEMASTNLVLELSIIMVALLGWQLTLAELVLLFRMFLSRELHEEAKKQADNGVAGRMEGHAEMDSPSPRAARFGSG
jgi:hypothetical protein